MRKLISVLAAGLTAFACLPFTAAADNAEEETKLPFDLTAPENVNISYLDGRDSLNTCEIHYSQNNSMSEWSTKLSDPETHDAAAAELGEMGYDDMWINAQIDWSIDSQDDWKCNDYWLTEGYDEAYGQHLGEWAYISEAYSNETAMDEWIFRYMGNIDDPEDTRWYGRHVDSDDYDGWGDVLKEGQYTVEKTDDESLARIDFDEHTIYVRVRWLVTVRPLEGDDIHIASDWSDIAAVGRYAEKAGPLKPGDIEPPVISGLKYLDDDFNGYPVIGFKLDVTPELAKQAAQVSGTSGAIWMCAEAKLQSSDEWVELQGDFDLKSGDMKIALQALAEKEGNVEKDTPVELRARYWCSQSEQEDFYSDYSEILTFDSLDMEVTTVPVTETTAVPETSASTTAAVTTTTAVTTTHKDKCKVCGICPQPFGICLFILIAIILVIIGGIIAAVLIMKKKNDNLETDTVSEKPSAPPAQENKLEDTSDGTDDDK